MNVLMDFGDYMRALAAMPGVPSSACRECFGTGARPVMCCNGHECGCYGQPIDYKQCECGTPFPTEEQIQKYVPSSGEAAK